MKLRLALLLCLFGLSTSGAISRALFPSQYESIMDNRSDGIENAPTAETPPDLVAAWLRFHEAELCQGIDAEFRFHEAGLEIWCRAEDQRSFEKMEEKLKPIFAAGKVEIHTKPTQSDLKARDDRNPPPSLWNNAELRSYLEDPSVRDRSLVRLPGHIAPPREDDQEAALKRRITLFADQTLEWDKKLKRYAEDLPALMREATSASAPPGLRTKAASVCLAHTQNLGKFTEKLEESLGHAFPRGPKRWDFAAEGLGDTADSAGDDAGKISRAAQSVARRIYLFIYPQQYTVGLVDLKEPAILESLSRLRAMTRRFLARDWNHLGLSQEESRMSSVPSASNP